MVRSTTSSSSRVAAGVVATLVLAASSANAQASQCLSLKGSEQCPSFQDAYINPANLSNAWPWFSQVNDVASFDEQFSRYFTDATRFTAEKLNRQLDCTRPGAANTTLQWERTILCGQFSQISYSASCNVENRAQAIMVCQDTCLAYSASQRELVANPAICAPDSTLGAARNATRYETLNRDYVSCTDWTTLVSLDNTTCIEGASNEGNCGYGPGVSTQLCEACDPSGNNTVPACCYDRNTQLAQCAAYGHPGAAAILPTTSVQTGFASATSAAPTGAAASAANNNSDNDGANLTGGQLAGIIVGCIAGALLLGALLAFLIFGRRRRRNNDAGRAAVYGGAAGSRSADKAWANSEDGTRGSLDGPSPIPGEKSGAVTSTAAAVGLGAGAGAGVGAAAAADRPISGLTSQSGGTDGRGTTVAAVRDQYTGQDMVPGEEVIAIYPYNASLNDEITLEPDQKVTLVRLYDDGWALGRTADGKEGALPLVCVSSTKGELPRSGGGTGSSATGTGTGTSDSETGGFTTENERTDAYASANEGGFMSDAPSAASRRL